MSSRAKTDPVPVIGHVLLAVSAISNGALLAFAAHIPLPMHKEDKWILQSRIPMLHQCRTLPCLHTCHSLQQPSHVLAQCQEPSLSVQAIGNVDLKDVDTIILPRMSIVYVVE